MTIEVKNYKVMNLIETAHNILGNHQVLNFR